VSPTFHDYKKAGIDSARLHAWSKKPSAGKSLINTRGTTWRKLPVEQPGDRHPRAAADRADAGIPQPDPPAGHRVPDGGQLRRRPRHRGLYTSRGSPARDTGPNEHPSTIQRFLLEDLDIRGAIVRLDDVWQALQAKRDYPPSVARPARRHERIASVIAGNLKQAGRLTIQLRATARSACWWWTCTEALNLRGYAKASDEAAGKTGIADLVGDGQLLLTLDMPGLRHPYQSYVPIEGNSVAEIFEHYLTQSEQQPAALHTAGLVPQRGLPVPAEAPRRRPQGPGRLGPGHPPGRHRARGRAPRALRRGHPDPPLPPGNRAPPRRP
jgi:hypothetical protein